MMKGGGAGEAKFTAERAAAATQKQRTGNVPYMLQSELAISGQKVRRAHHSFVTTKGSSGTCERCMSFLSAGFGERDPGIPMKQPRILAAAFASAAACARARTGAAAGFCGFGRSSRTCNCPSQILQAVILVRNDLGVVEANPESMVACDFEHGCRVPLAVHEPERFHAVVLLERWS